MDPRMMQPRGQAGMYDMGEDEQMMPPRPGTMPPQPDPGAEDGGMMRHQPQQMPGQGRNQMMSAAHEASESPMQEASEPEHDESMEGQGGGGYSDLTADTVFEPDDRVQYVLWNRFSMADEAEVDMLDQMVTPENLPLWLKFFPELAELLHQASAMDAVMGMGQEDIMQQYGGMPQGQPAGAQSVMMPQQAPQASGLAAQRF